MTQGHYVSTPRRLQFKFGKVSITLHRFVNVIISVPTPTWSDLIGLHASGYVEKEKTDQSVHWWINFAS